MEFNLVTSRTADAIRLCDNTSYPKFFGFLRPEEAADAKATAEKLKGKFCFYGGYPSAERVFFCSFPDWCDDPESLFPIKALTFTFRKEDTLSHRHFLGTFMSLGITRESVGDILIEQGRAVAFFTEEIVTYVKEQITKVSGTGVTVTEGYEGALPGMSGFETVTDTVASLRLDCVVSSLAKCSRNQATQMIEAKLVSVNSLCIEKSTKTISTGDTVTVKGKGKFIIDSADERTKKDRVILVAKKYI